MTDERDPGSLGALIDDGYGMYVYCEARGCFHNKELDLRALADKFGRDTNMKQSILPKMRCTKCGSKKVSVRLIAPGTSAAGY